MPANNPAPARNSRTLPTATGRCRSRPRSTSALPPRRTACQANPATSTRPIAMGTSTSGSPNPPADATRDRPKRTPTRPGGSRAAPTTSSGRASVGASCGSVRHAVTNPTMSTGTFTQKSHGQVSQVRITPPITGPSIGPIRIGRVTRAIMRPVIRPPAACMGRVAISGSRMPPPTPCTARAPISQPAEGAKLAATEPRPKTISPASHTRRPPQRACAQAASGMVTPTASR